MAGSAIGSTWETCSILSGWIAAICIYQNDLDERAKQVQIMLKIYQSAREVHIYLGDEPEDAALLFDLMHRLEKVLTEHYNDEEQFYYTDFESLGLPTAESKSWEVWQELLARPYFSRAWVIQEFSAPKNAYMSLGKYGFHSHVLPWLCLEMQNHGFAEEHRPIAKDSRLSVSATKAKKFNPQVSKNAETSARWTTKAICRPSVHATILPGN
jgi:hypothetical protein